MRRGTRYPAGVLALLVPVAAAVSGKLVAAAVTGLAAAAAAVRGGPGERLAGLVHEAGGRAQL